MGFEICLMELQLGRIYLRMIVVFVDLLKVIWTFLSKYAIFFCRGGGEGSREVTLLFSDVCEFNYEKWIKIVYNYLSVIALDEHLEVTRKFP